MFSSSLPSKLSSGLLTWQNSDMSDTCKSVPRVHLLVSGPSSACLSFRSLLSFKKKKKKKKKEQQRKEDIIWATISSSILKEMDGDLQPRKQKIEVLRVEDELGIGSRSESPCMTGFEDNSADAKEKEKPSVQMSTEWTNEKHILYLNSKEASFVTKMHSHEYHMMDLRTWRLRKRKMLQPYLISSTGNVHFPSGQFKVLRRGCWEKINFRKAQAQLNIGNESHLFSNPWIKHFMQYSNDQELADVQSSSPQGGSVLPSEAIHTQRRKCRTMNCRLAMSSDHPLSHHSYKHDQDFDDSNAEFSDQNFVDEDGLKGEQLINSWIEKTVNITGDDVSIKD